MPSPDLCKLKHVRTLFAEVEVEVFLQLFLQTSDVGIVQDLLALAPRGLSSAAEHPGQELN